MNKVISQSTKIPEVYPRSLQARLHVHKHQQKQVNPHTGTSADTHVHATHMTKITLTTQCVLTVLQALDTLPEVTLL